MKDLFSQRALDVVDEIDGTVMLALAEGRVSMVELVATLRFLEQKYSTMTEAAMADASDQAALGNIDEDPPPPADTWKGGV